MRSLAVCLALAPALAFAGPPQFSYFSFGGFVPTTDGVWVLGSDNCDEAGMQPVSLWLGRGPRPAGDAPKPRDRRVASAGATVFQVGDHGAILESTDGGKSFAAQRSGTQRDLSAVWARGPRDAYAVGAHGTLLATHDGKTWRAVATRVSTDFTAVWGAGDDVYVAGADPIASHDRGATWKPIRGDGLPMEDVVGTSADEVYGVVLFGSIVRSADHGGTWQRLDLLVSGHRCY